MINVFYLFQYFHSKLPQKRCEAIYNKNNNTKLEKHLNWIELSRKININFWKNVTKKAKNKHPYTHTYIHNSCRFMATSTSYLLIYFFFYFFLHLLLLSRKAQKGKEIILFCVSLLLFLFQLLDEMNKWMAKN